MRLFALFAQRGSGGGPDRLRGWANACLDEMQSMLAGAGRPERLATYAKRGARWRVWSLLKRPDGTHYRSLAELCAEPPPYGLGCAESDLAPRARSGSS